MHEGRKELYFKLGMDKLSFILNECNNRDECTECNYFKNCRRITGIDAISYIVCFVNTLGKDEYFKGDKA